MKTNTKTVLAWRNKFSGEEGYVKSVSKAKGYFINTFDSKDAKGYRSENMINTDLNILANIGELVNNDFYTTDVVV